MQKEQLALAAENLSKAALEFEEACTVTYRHYCRQLYQTKQIGISGKAQIALQDTVRALTRLNIYSACQARAITAAFSAWHPPKADPAQSVPVRRSGGAA